jgi:hypothetical protein
MPKIALEELQSLIEKIRRQVMTSNHVVDRAKQPYYHSHDSVPQELITFKEILSSYRKVTSELIDKLHNACLYKGCLPSHADWNDLSSGSFYNHFISSLVVSSFGIAECAECSTILSTALVRNGFGDLAFVGINFPKASQGMEMGHQFLITNLSKMPVFHRGKVTCDELFASLPEDAFIGDAFLGISFSPKNVSKVFQDYVQAYGGATKVSSFRHQYNCRRNFFTNHLLIAKDVKQKLVHDNLLPGLDFFSDEEHQRKNEEWFPSDEKVSPFFEQDKSILTLPVLSENVSRYTLALNRVLGGKGGQKIVQKNQAGTSVSFPSFWLRQLGNQQVQELAEGLGADPDQFLQLCRKT